MALAAGMGLLAASLPAHANSEGGIGRALAALQLQDQRLQDIGWRLVAGNARYCMDARPETGLLLQDVMGFDAPDRVRDALGIEGDIAVQAVAEGSPAALAGLRPKDEVLEIGGKTTALPVGGPGDYDRLTRLQMQIESEMATRGQLTLRVRAADGAVRDLSVTGTPACPSRFEVLTGRDVAQADGERVQIGQRYGQTDDPSAALAGEEYAVIVAHELAHNLLRHRAVLDRIGRSWGNVRMTEREADRLSVWLLFNAGFDPEIAVRTTEGWRRRRDAGLLRAPTHEGWRNRRAIIAAEIGRMRAIVSATGLADWSTEFIRELAEKPAR